MEDLMDFLFETTDDFIEPSMSFDDMKDSILEDNSMQNGESDKEAEKNSQ